MTQIEQDSDLDLVYENSSLAQQMIVEVLIARYRLGENLWTFPAQAKVSLKALQEKGIVNLMSGVVERTVRASLTCEAVSKWIKDDYVPPVVRASRTSEVALGDKKLIETARKIQDSAVTIAENQPGIKLSDLITQVGLDNDLKVYFVDTVIYALLSDGYLEFGNESTFGAGNNDLFVYPKKSIARVE